MRCRIGVVLAALALPVVIGGQTPTDGTSVPQRTGTPVFRSGVEAVRFEAIVTDEDGKPITDLTADDFEVREDDAPQTIEQFTRVVLPAPRAHEEIQPASIRADISLNDSTQDRVYVLVFDTLSWKMATRSAQIVRRFLDDYFADGDVAAVVSLEHPGALRFTNDRQALVHETDAVLEKYDVLHQWQEEWERRDRPLASSMREAQAERVRRATERAAIFGDIARSLSHIEARRKSIIYISESLLFDPYDAVDNPTSTFSEEARAFMEPIMAGNLSVYPIQPGGADVEMDMGGGTAPAPGPMRMNGPLTFRTMRALAYVTGGVPTGTGTDLARTFEQIVRDNSAYYVLGYQSTNPKRDGGFRRIQVKVKRKGAKVRARTGYFVEMPPIKNPNALFSFDGRIVMPRPFVPPSDLTPALTRAMESPVTLTAVPITVFAAAHKTDARKATVTVVLEIPASGLDLTRTDEEISGQLDVAVGATQGLRSIHSDGFTYDLHLRGQAREQFDAHGLRVTVEMPFEPGAYRLGVAAGGRGGRIGKTFYDLTVPDFAQPLLAMSGVSLTSAAANGMVTLQPEHVRPGLPSPATVSRLFERSDALVLYTEVYENIWWTDAAHTITLNTELRGPDGTVIPVNSERRASATPHLKEGGYPFTVSLHLDAVPPGSYVLHVEAQSDFEKGRSVAQDVPIQVQ
jgi:VWFA-related protein